MRDLYDLAKKWYDGYTFGECNVYNPWSMIKFIKEQKASRNTFPKPYWVNVSSNAIVRELIDMADDIDDLDGKTEEALAQIKDRKYREEVRSMGDKNISSYGIAFCGKQCKVKCGA